MSHGFLFLLVVMTIVMFDETSAQDCPAKKYLPAGKTAPGGCVACKKCTAKQTVFATCTATSNTVCSDCPAGNYLPAKKKAPGGCAVCKVCPDNQVQATACNPKANTLCGVACETGKTWSKLGIKPCSSCTKCAGNEYTKAACTTTSDNVCAPCDTSCKTCSGAEKTKCKTCNAPNKLQTDFTCSVCARGKYMAADGTCKACDKSCVTCNGAGKKACSTCNSPATLQTDNSCALNKGCSAGKYLPAGKTAPDGCAACHKSCVTCNGAGKKACFTCNDTATLQTDNSCAQCWKQPTNGFTRSTQNAPLLQPLVSDLATCQTKCASTPTCPAIAFLPAQTTPRVTPAKCYVHTAESWAGTLITASPYNSYQQYNYTCQQPVAGCPAGKYLPAGKTAPGGCVACHASCKTCSAAGSIACTSCTAPAKLQPDKSCKAASS